MWVGKWAYGSGADRVGCLEDDCSWSNTSNDTMRLRFFGTRIRLYGLRAKHLGTGMVSVDDGEESKAVFRAPGYEYKVLVYESPDLPAGPHTLKLRVTDGYSVPDYVEIDSPRGEPDKIIVLGRDSVFIPKAEGRSVRYSARVLNTYGCAIPGESVTWSLRSPVKGVSLDSAAGIVTISNTVTAGSALVLVATAGKLETVKTVKITLGTYDRAMLTPDALAALAAGQPGGEVWGKAFDKRKVTFLEEALGSLRSELAPDPFCKFYREYRLPLDVKGGPDLAKHATVPTWTLAGAYCLAPAMAFCARETKDPVQAAEDLTTARNAADTAIALSYPPGWACAGFPNMVREATAGPVWKGYLAGEKTFEEWRDWLLTQEGVRHDYAWDCRVSDPGLMFLDMYDATKEQKYLDAAKRMAKTYSNTQLPSGAWPYFFNAKTGKAAGETEWPPAMAVWFLDRLAAQYGIRDYEQTADRAFAWIWEKEVVPFDIRAHYHDVVPSPRGSQGALAGAEIAICLFDRAERNPEYIAKGEEILGWIEKTFVSWDQGGAVSEQTGYMVKVRFAGGGVAQAFVKAYEVTGDPVYLAKGLTIFHTVLTGKDPWLGWRAAINALDVYPFLKKHNLPGGE